MEIKIGEKRPHKKHKPAVDMRVYTRYVLKGEISIEKRELLANLRNKLVLEDKKLTLTAL